MPSSSGLPFKITNKIKRQQVHLKRKKTLESEKRAERFRRKKEEDKNPQLREQRRAQNVPKTIDGKRIWDEINSDEESILGLAVDLERLSKRRKVEDEATDFEAFDDDEADAERSENVEAGSSAKHKEQDEEEADDDLDSMLEDSGSEEASNDSNAQRESRKLNPSPPREPSPPASTTSTNLALTPEALQSRFPSLFITPAPTPKVLITTSLHGTLHAQAKLLTNLFPNAVYVRRSAHSHAHKFSVREIASFAANRNFTHVVILMEDQKKPHGLDIVHLPEGPMFHFSLTNWIDGKKIPGHGNPTGHIPELILNNFRTPLGLLAAHLFRTLFPASPELMGRTVVTLHNQRDFIFLRRHRYIFRDKRETEKSIIGAAGQIVKGGEDIRAGLQELGPRFTLKLRRVDKGIQRRSGQEWEWKGKTDRVRTKFQL
jgi:ribosome production factor 1